MRSARHLLLAAMAVTGLAAWVGPAGYTAEVDRIGTDMLAQAAVVPPPQAAEQIRLMKGYLDLVADIERAAGSPLGATTVAVFAIVEMGKQDSETAIEKLQSLLEQEQAASGRTVIRLGLKDLYEKPGNREAAIEQPAVIVRENADARKEQEQRRPPPPPPPQR